MSARRFIPVAVVALAALACEAAGAQGRVQLELAADERVAITGRQEWLARLSQAGIEGFRIRSKNPGDEPRIERGGTAEAPLYTVTGILTSDDRLLLPGARFTAGQLGQLAAWLRELAEKGPPETRPALAAFGLVEDDFALLLADLSPALGFDTRGMTRADVIRLAARQMATRLAADPSLAGPLGGDKVPENLGPLSRGTALACLLRPHGLCLVPRKQDGQLALSIVPASDGLEIWPIGWEPKKPEKDVKPEMFEFLNVNVSGVTVTKVLEAAGQRLAMPILLDHNALARHGLEPDNTLVELPPSRTTYSIMLRKVLFQGRLKAELRVDESDRPFLWVTSIKPL